MGVDIGDLFKEEKITYDDLKDRIIAIDAYNVLHQFLSIIRQRDYYSGVSVFRPWSGGLIH